MQARKTKVTRTVWARCTLRFKQEAVRLVTGGQSIAAAARSLGVVEQTLFNWVKADRQGKLCVRRAGLGGPPVRGRAVAPARLEVRCVANRGRRRTACALAGGAQGAGGRSGTQGRTTPSGTGRRKRSPAQERQPGGGGCRHHACCFASQSLCFRPWPFALLVVGVRVGTGPVPWAPRAARAPSLQRQRPMCRRRSAWAWAGSA